ncbi:MAG TPA: hypothetical protein VN628_09960 [Vicinamibacterales bacterium]|nr:hypothetical protein [Vicinamibacterales bacterium]
MIRSAVPAFLFAAFALSGCSAGDPVASPMVTPTLTLSRDRVPLGTPIEMTYKFVVAADAKIASNYKVMVHFGDQDDQLMYTDDHDPPKPTSQWKPGETVEYTRTFFTPVYPYVGEASIEVGMYAPNEKFRMPMAGTDTGHRSYKIKTFQLVPQAEGVQMIYKDGFQSVEGATGNGVGWHWTKREAVFAVKNPKKDATLYLDVDNPSALLNAPQQVTVALGGAMLDQFTLAAQTPMLRKIPVSSAAWGSGENVDLTIAVDKTFIPEQLSPGSKDPRELGIRVMHAAIVPR